MVTLRTASLDELLPLAQSLFEQHAEDATAEGRMPMRLQEDVLRKLDDAGLVAIVGAFDDKGALVGYAAAAVIAGMMHDATVMSMLGLMVAREHRGKLIGRRLVRFLHELSRTRGAELAQWWVPLGSPLAGILMSEGGVAREQLYEVNL